MKIYYQYIKRILDVIFSAFSLVALLPFIIILAGAVKIDTKGPAFFAQERVGKAGRIFKVYKIRTMRVETQIDGRMLSDSERLTRLGQCLRKLSLDELPQLFNVLKGEMSLIGPRPLFVKYMPYYTQEEKERHSVRPGITGWAQVNGRNSISWREKFTFDLEYVKNISLLFDIRIVILTFLKIFKRADVLDNYLQDLDMERKAIGEVAD